MLLLSLRFFVILNGIRSLDTVSMYQYKCLLWFSCLLNPTFFLVWNLHFSFLWTTFISDSFHSCGFHWRKFERIHELVSGYPLGGAVLRFLYLCMVSGYIHSSLKFQGFLTCSVGVDLLMMFLLGNWGFFLYRSVYCWQRFPNYKGVFLLDPILR